jgi:hypothetical protein
VTYGDATDALKDVERLRRLSEADRRASSVPLVVFGVLTIISAPLVSDGLTVWSFFYWLIAGPAGFLLIAAWFRRRRLRYGIGSGKGSYLKTGLVLLISFVLVPFLWIIPFVTIAIALFVIAVRQRNTYLAVCAVAFGVLGELEGIFFFDNQLYRLAKYFGLYKSASGYFNNATTIVYATIGVLTLFAGLFARRLELKAAREEN